MVEDLQLPDEIWGFGSWLLWLVATRAATLVDRVYELRLARPSRTYGMAEGHHVPTPALIAWLLRAAESGLTVEKLAQRSDRLDERQKVLRTTVSRAINGESRLFKESWLRDLAVTCNLTATELEFILSSRDDERHPVDCDALRIAITNTFRSAAATATTLNGATGATSVLPYDLPSFTGRELEIQELTRAAEGTGSGEITQICAIDGMAGSGKTAIAVHFAYKVAENFPDGHFFMHLHGHSTARRPVDPVDALWALLIADKAAPQTIPGNLEARAGMWRERTAGRRVLLVLDDAIGTEQVSPLLPGNAGTLVLITSRKRLVALPEAHRISIDVLNPADAARLFVRLADRPSLRQSDRAVGDAVRLCGHLPLAIRLLAGQLKHHQAWTVADLVTSLVEDDSRLARMAAEHVSVAAAFELSYRNLPPDLQRLFRRLGLHPGTDIDAYAASALDANDLATTAMRLDALYNYHLVDEPVRGRYRFHDLIRDHARSLVALDPADDRALAVDRLLSYYQQAAQNTDFYLARFTRPAAASAVTSVALAVPSVGTRDQAHAWMTAEHANILACISYATRNHRQVQLVGLTGGIAAHLRERGPWDKALILHSTASETAALLGDKVGQANALHHLSVIQRLVGDYPAQADALERALAIYRDTGNQLGQANALTDLGLVHYSIDNYADAVLALEKALDVYRQLGESLGEANALYRLGAVCESSGDYPGATHVFERALVIYRNRGDRTGEANVLNELGAVRQFIGEYQEAADIHDQAWNIYRELGDKLGEAGALNDLSRAQLAVGDYSGAILMSRQALSIYHELGSQLGQANALRCLGTAQQATGEITASAAFLEQARDIYQRIGDRIGQAEVLNHVGALYLSSGASRKAAGVHEQALDIARTIHASLEEARALEGIGRCALATHEDDDIALEKLYDALKIYRHIGAAEASRLSAEIASIRPT
jgi:tetratricopeptide (TPR) repeat protein